MKFSIFSSKNNTGGANIDVLQKKLNELELDDQQYERLRHFLIQKEQVDLEIVALIIIFN